MRPIVIGGIYRHYKRGNIYKVITLSNNKATRERTVIYLNINTGQVWDTPLSDFNQQLPDGNYKYADARFEAFQEISLT